MRAGDSYYKEFVTSAPTTGSSTDADSLPAATGNHNGTDDGTWVLTVVHMDTGRYKVTGTVPAYSPGDTVNVSVAATVAGVSGKAVVDTFSIDRPALLDLTQAVPTSNTAQTLGDALNAARAQGFGKWALAGTTLTLYAPDGNTAVRSFTLDSASVPTTRS
jgi:hypothetical protein